MRRRTRIEKIFGEHESDQSSNVRQRIRHAFTSRLLRGTCQRSPASQIFGNPSANPAGDNATSTWPDPGSQLKSLFTLRQPPNSVKANRHQAHNRSRSYQILKRLIGSYSKSEAIAVAVAGMRCFIRSKCQFGVAKIWGPGPYLSTRLSSCHRHLSAAQTEMWKRDGSTSLCHPIWACPCLVSS